MGGLITLYLIIGFCSGVAAMECTFHGVTLIAWITCWPYMWYLSYKEHQKKVHKVIKDWWATKPWKVRI